MALTVSVKSIGERLFQLLIYSDGMYIGEYERSQEADVERKKREIANAEAVLLEVFRKHGPFVVRWNRQARQKSIRVNDVQVGTVPKAAWETPSWERGD